MFELLKCYLQFYALPCYLKIKTNGKKSNKTVNKSQIYEKKTIAVFLKINYLDSCGFQLKVHIKYLNFHIK